MFRLSQAPGTRENAVIVTSKTSRVSSICRHAVRQMLLSRKQLANVALHRMPAGGRSHQGEFIVTNIKRI